MADPNPNKNYSGVSPFGDSTATYEEFTPTIPVEDAIGAKTGYNDEGDQVNSESVSPFQNPVYDETASNLEDLVARAEAAAEDAEQSAIDAEISQGESEQSAQEAADSASEAANSASEANQSAQDAAASASEAADSAAAAEDSADRAEAAVSNIDTLTTFAQADILNTATTPTTVSFTHGDVNVLLNGTQKQAVVMNIQVNRKTDDENCFATYVYDFHFINGLWYAQQRIMTVIAAQDPLIVFGVSNTLGMGSLIYQVIPLAGANYIGVAKFNAQSYYTY